MGRLASAVAAMTMLAIPAHADDSTGIVVDLARRSIDRGFGADCSLDMRPVERGGYYPCLDFGPYRVVIEYDRVSGFVVARDREPFLVMTAGQRGRGFVVPGPWETDMAVRLTEFWNDEVEGGLARRVERERNDSARRAAEEYVRSMNGSSPPPTEATSEDTSPPTPNPPAVVAGGGQPPTGSPMGGGIEETLVEER